jgi:hypothetical protein
MRVVRVVFMPKKNPQTALMRVMRVVLVRVDPRNKTIAFFLPPAPETDIGFRPSGWMLSVQIFAPGEHH